MKARELKPKVVKFLPDLSSCTIQKRKEKVPDLLAARKQVKLLILSLTGLSSKKSHQGTGNQMRGLMATKKFSRGEIVIVKSLLMNNDATIIN